MKVKQVKHKLKNSTVALEASRGLSTLHTAKYSDIKQFTSGTRHKHDRTGLLEELRIEGRSLRKNLELSELRLSHADISAVQAERALQQAIETYERLAQENKRLRKHIADNG